jgi:hypothetical protein
MAGIRRKIRFAMASPVITASHFQLVIIASRILSSIDSKGMQWIVAL